MIADKDRSGWFGASDSKFICGNWNTKTFKKFWMQKMVINNDHFDNKYTLAGNNYERKILESLGLPMKFDRQILLPELCLRVNLDGETTHSPCIYECKTYKYENGWKLRKEYVQQVQVQMYASGIHFVEIIAYGLLDEDYKNFFNPIDTTRIQRHSVAYDDRWINEVYLPKLRRLAECLKMGVLPSEITIR